jgi:serine phosphatase RsbU (regulator of sigma subunit)
MATSSFLASFYFVAGIIIFFLAVAILRQSARNIVNWATALVLFFASFGPILGAMSYLLEQNPRAGTVLFKNLVASFDYIWEFFFPSLVLFALVYPRRNRLWRYIKYVVFLLFLPHLFHLVMLIFLIGRVNPERMFHGLSELRGSLSLFAGLGSRLGDALNVFMSLLFKAHVQLFGIVNIAYAAFSMALLGASLRQDLSPRVRRQLRMVIAGLGLCIVTFSAARVLPAIAGAAISERVYTGLINATLIVGASAIAYAIVRYQFLDMRIIARRGILYAAAAALFATVYFLIIRQIISFFYQFSGARVEILNTGFIILFIIAFQPILGRFEEWSDRLLVRERRNPRLRIRGLANELLSMIDVAAMKTRVSEVLKEVFDADEARLVLCREAAEQSGGDPELARSFETLCKAGEPMSRLDFLEAMGYPVQRGGKVVRRGRRLSPEALSNVSDGVRALAAFELLVPVIHDVDCVATLGLGKRREYDHYTSEEQALLSMLAAQIAASLANIELLKEVVEKRVMEEELNIARSIQLKLLPSEPPELDRYEVAAMSLSSKQVGGDYYDFLHRGRYLAIAVADVSGKGVPASLLMASLQASLRSNMDRMEWPVEVVTKLNQMMCATTAEDKFATLFYGCVDMDSDALSYTNAGHVFPIVIKNDRRVETLDYSGLILGVVPDFRYEHKRVALSPGDTLVVMTDGVTEAANPRGDLFGDERLKVLLPRLWGLPAQDVIDRIVEHVNIFTGAKGAGDDLTILVLRRKV